MIEEQNKEPLVSIIVITYNSSKYVLETLESAYNQTYQNIELIISDDCSTDDTVEICKKWLEKHKDRFVNTAMITVKENTGIPANCNRGLYRAKGEWVKFIAGDDLLLENCIIDNVDFGLKNTNSKIFLSRVKTLKNGILIESEIPIGIKINFKAKDAQGQYQALLKRYFGSTPSIFIAKEVFKKINYDENIKYIEDYPFALNATKAGYVFAFINKETVVYRLHRDSIMNKKDGKLFGDFYKKRHEFDLKYRHPFIPIFDKKKELFEYNRKVLMERFNLNHDNMICRIINKISLNLNPYKYF